MKKLADTRSEYILYKGAVRFDATDLSLAYAALLKDQYNNKRKPAEKRGYKKLALLLSIKNYQEEPLQFILKNWSILLLSKGAVFNRNSGLKRSLKKLFVLKAGGMEEDYIRELQRNGDLRKLLESVLLEYVG